MRGLSQTGQGMSKWKSLGDDFLIFVIKAGLGAFCFPGLEGLSLVACPALLRQQLFLAGKPPAIAGQCAVRANYAVARHHDRHGVRRASSRNRTPSLGLPERPRDLRIR